MKKLKKAFDVVQSAVDKFSPVELDELLKSPQRIDSPTLCQGVKPCTQRTIAA